MTPKRIQRKNTKGWRMLENAVYVGNGSLWENPFRVIQYSDGKFAVKTSGVGQCKILTANCHAAYDFKKDAETDAIKCYELFMFPYPHRLSDLRNLKLLKGKDLACWCKPDEVCHADLLLKVANN